MKILYCIPALYNPGGMERVLTEKVNYLVSLADYEIFIVTTDQQAKDLRFPLDSRIKLFHLDIDFNSHYNYPLVKKYIAHRKKMKQYKASLIKLLNDFQIDVCISLCGKEIDFLSSLPVKSKKIAEIHFAMNFRKQFLVSRKSGFIWALLGDLRTLSLKKSVKGLDKLVVLTKNDRQQWEKTHSNIIQIPNVNPLESLEVSDLLQKKVISVGKLDPQKGYDLLIESWKIVSNKHPDWVLEIYGQGEWEEKLKSRSKELQLESSFFLCGLTDDVQTKYLNSSIYVMSSRYEGFGMVLVESMSCGLPVVSFDCEYGPSEIITNEVDGFLVEPNNIQSLADKICVLIENDTLRKEMGNNALSSVKRFDKENVMSRWVSLFESMVSI